MKSPVYAILTGFFLIHIATTRADILEMDDGRRFAVTVVAQDEQFVLIQANGFRAQIPRQRIVRIEPGETEKLRAGDMAVFTPLATPGLVQGFGIPLPAPTSDAECPEPFAESGKWPSPDGKQPLDVTHERTDDALPTAPEVQLPLPRDPAAQERLRQWVQALASDNTTDANDVRRLLQQSGDEGLAALIAYGLYHPSPDTRTAAADALGEFGGARVLRYLIEAFFASAQPTVPPYQVGYVRTLIRHISRITGRDFSFDVNSSARGPEVASRAVEWWRLNAYQLPAQLGDPQPSREDPQYVTYRQRDRGLNLQHREFPGQIFPPNLNIPELPAGPTNFARIPKLRSGEEFNRQFLPAYPPLAPPTVERGPIPPEEFNKNLPAPNTPAPRVVPNLR